ncbi:hypothetical protein FRAHR75_1000010 [Frankia sp. Hr75.2]|nr:hypothetical protein FRAHR75_1000010 [Frankia sp. Hr75.2]
MEDALGFVRRHSLHGADITPVRRTDRWNLPPVVAREAVVNAVAHADYRQRGAPIRIAVFDDRLEVESPGLLQFGLTVDDIRRGVSKLRNRFIGRAFHSLRLTEQWGSGIQRITTACLDAALPLPDLEEIGTRFRVTLWTQRIQSPTLDNRDRAILAAIPTGGALTSEIANAIELSTRATRTRLIKLVDRGLVRELGAGRRARSDATTALRIRPGSADKSYTHRLRILGASTDTERTDLPTQKQALKSTASERFRARTLRRGSRAPSVPVPGVAGSADLRVGGFDGHGRAVDLQVQVRISAGWVALVTMTIGVTWTYSPSALLRRRN